MKNTKPKNSIIFDDDPNSKMEHDAPPEGQDWSGNLDDLYDIPTEILELGWGAVASKSWQWMPGMAVIKRGRFRDYCDIERIRAISKKGEIYLSELSEPFDLSKYLPVVDDPATKGCLLHLIREKIGANVSPIETNLGWILPKVIEKFHPTEAHILVAALKEEKSHE